MKFSSCSLLLAAVTVSIAEAAESAVFSATLSGLNEVPALQTDVTGSASMVWNQDTSPEALSFFLQIDNPSMINMLGVPDLGGVHIHCGEEGSNGSVIAWLVPEIPGGITDSSFSYSGVLTDSDILGEPGEARPCGSVVSEVLEALEDGRVYVNVHSTPNPPGEVRGQLLKGEASRIQLFDATLSGDQHEPPVSTNVSGDIRFVYASGDPGMAFYSNFLNPDGVKMFGAAGMHIHCGQPGTNGAVISTLVPERRIPSIGAEISEYQTFTEFNADAGCGGTAEEVAASMAQGMVYVNAHSTENPSGEVRGDISLTPAAPTMSPTISMSPTMNPTSSPAPTVTYSPTETPSALPEPQETEAPTAGDSGNRVFLSRAIVLATSTLVAQFLW